MNLIPVIITTFLELMTGLTPFNSGHVYCSSPVNQRLTNRTNAAASDRPQAVAAHAGPITCMAVDPDGQLLVTGGTDQEVRIWKVANLERFNALKRLPAQVLSVAISPDRRTVATSVRGQDKVQVWDLMNGDLRFELEAQSKNLQSLTYSSDGRLLAAGSEAGEIRIWNLEWGGKSVEIHNHTGQVYSVAFAAEDRILVSAGQDRTVQLWDLEKGERVGLLVGHSDRVVSLAVEQSGRILASAGLDETVRLWDLAAMKELRVIRRSRGLLHRHVTYAYLPLPSVAFSPGGKTLVCAGYDLPITLYDVETARRVRSISSGRALDSSIAIASSNAILFTGDTDGNIHMISLR